MTSASVELQTFIFNRLVADAGVGALAGDRIYDNVPASPTFPYISFGPSDYYTDDADCIPTRVETIQIDCWVRAQGKLRPARELADAVKAALHEYPVEFLGTAEEFSGNALAELRVASVRVMGDPDGITSHGVVTVEARIEEA